MEHVGVSAHSRKVIMALYDNPTFLVRDSTQKSTIRTQTKGLRQGCPLSPYLFGFVLTISSISNPSAFARRQRFFNHFNHFNRFEMAEMVEMEKLVATGGSISSSSSSTSKY